MEHVLKESWSWSSLQPTKTPALGTRAHSHPEACDWVCSTMHSHFYSPASLIFIRMVFVVFCTTCIPGAPALTSRQFKEAEFERVVDFLDEGFKIALDVKKKTSEFKRSLPFLIYEVVIAICRALYSVSKSVFM